MSLKSKLQRMKGHMTKEAPSIISPSTPAAAVPFLERWRELQARPFGTGEEYVMVREVRYPITQKHGRYHFHQLHEVIEAWGEACLNHPLSAAEKTAEELLFFDTETTGLQGGVGNTIFLLGYSRIEGEDVVVRQHFLAEPHAEVTLYQSFLQDVRTSAQLVTFNGKSFDWPQVKTRHTLVRDSVPELPSFGHYDLLHGARRLWKNELESCRLSVIEQTKLGVHRENDLPGFMAPIAYFDYLVNKDPETVSGVLRHNELDVLSLITLYIHISKLLLEQGSANVSSEERFEIARWYEALGAHEYAVAAYRQIAASQHPLRHQAKIALGRRYKKQNNWQAALTMWEEVIQDTAYPSEEVLIEIAKTYEHQAKDYEKALHYTRLAIDAWKRRGNLLRLKNKKEWDTYEKRIERLQRKLDLATYSDHLISSQS